MSRSKLAIRGFTTTLAFTAVTLVLGFWSTAVLQNWLGLERFGAARALQEWINHLNVLDLGLSGAVAPLLAKLLGQGRVDEARGLLRYAFRMYLRIAGLCLIVGLALTPLLGIIIKDGDQLGRELQWAWLALVAVVPTIAANPARAWLESRQQAWRVNICLTFQAIWIVGLSLGFVAIGWGMAGQTAGFALGMLFFAVWVLTDARRVGLKGLPGTHEPTKDISDELKQELWSLAKPTFLLAVFGRAALMSDVLLTAAFAGGSSAAILYNATRLPLLVKDQLLAIAGSTWAAMAELDAQGDRSAFQERLFELTKVTAILGVSALTPILFYNSHFVWLWTKIPFDDLVITGLAAANALGLALWILWGWCFTGTGRTSLTVMPSVVGGGLNFAISLALTPILGMAGPLWGTFLSLYGLQLAWLAILLKRSFAISLRTLVFSAIKPVILVLPVGLVCGLVAQSHQPWGWIGLGAEMSGFALVCLILGVTLALNQEERERWKWRLLRSRRNP